MTESAPQSPREVFNYFFEVVEQLSQNAAIQKAKELTLDFDQRNEKIKEQEETMRNTTDELVRVKKELEKSERRWEEDHPAKIAEIFRIVRKEVQEVEDDKKTIESSLELCKDELIKEQASTESLKQEFEKLKKECEEIDKQNDVLTHKWKASEQAKSKLESDLEKVTEDLKTTGGLMEDKDAKIKELSSTKDKLQEQYTTLEKKFKDQVSILKKVQNFAPKLENDDVAEASDLLRGIWQRCYDAMSKFFEGDTPECVLQDPQCWKKPKELGVLPLEMPLPPSNSPVAKRIRTVVAMAVLADLLVELIFTSTYLFFDDEEVSRISFHLATTNPEKEQFFRRVLTSVAEDKENAVMGERIKNVLERAVDSFYPHLDEDSKRTFHTSLKDPLRSAINTWRSIQRRKGRFEADISLDTRPQWRWVVLNWDKKGNAFSEREVATEQLQDIGRMLVLFPRVFIVDGENESPVFPGVILPHSETKSAEDEWNKIRLSNPMWGRSPTKSRRMTLNEPNGNGQSFLVKDSP